MTTTTPLQKFTIEFYATALAEESDPDPTWRLNDVRFRDYVDAENKMLRFCEILFGSVPITFVTEDPREYDSDAIVVQDHNDENLGVLYIIQES